MCWKHSGALLSSKPHPLFETLDAGLGGPMSTATVLPQGLCVRETQRIECLLLKSWTCRDSGRPPVALEPQPSGSRVGAVPDARERPMRAMEFPGGSHLSKEDRGGPTFQAALLTRTHCPRCSGSGRPSGNDQGSGRSFRTGRCPRAEPWAAGGDPRPWGPQRGTSVTHFLC